MLNADGLRVQSPQRVREDSPISMVPSVPVPIARLEVPGGGYSSDPVLRQAASTPPMATPLMVSRTAPKLSRPLQRLVIHASTGQLPRPVTRSPSPTACYVQQTRSMSPLPRGSYWTPGRPGRSRFTLHHDLLGWGAPAGGQTSVRFNRSPRPRVSAGWGAQPLIFDQIKSNQIKSRQFGTLCQCAKVLCFDDDSKPFLADTAGRTNPSEVNSLVTAMFSCVPLVTCHIFVAETEKEKEMRS